MKKIIYVTENSAKIASAKQALEPLWYEIENIKIETPEIQADDVSQVAKYSAKRAAEKLNKAVIKNDSGLFVECLNGFPWVYTRYAEETIWEDWLLKLMEWSENRTAYFKESIAYCEPGAEPIVFEGITKGKIDTKKSWTYGRSWDFVFIPDWEEKTIWCFPDEKRFQFYSLWAYRELAKYLERKTSKE